MFHRSLVRCCRKRLREAAILFALLLAVPVCSPAPVKAQGGVTVHLPEQIAVPEGVVRLADLATITGASKRDIARVSHVDVLGLDERRTDVSLTRERIRLRLLLAGWDEPQVQFSGAEVVHVSVIEEQPWSDLRVEEEIRRVLVRQMGLPVDDLQVRLSAPFLETLPEPMQVGSDWRPDPLPPLRPGLGHMAITIRLWRGDQLVGARLAHCDVLRRFQVPVATATFGPMHQISQSDLHMEERFLSQQPAQLPVDQIVGRVLRTQVQVGDVIADRHLMPPSTVSDLPLIRPRDRVQVVARSGPLRVTLQAAEALESGREGQMIRLRNPTSNTVISGTVLADGRVEIVLR